MKRIAFLGTAGATLLSALLGAADPAVAASSHAVHANAAGGTTAGAVSVRQGPHGAAAARARALKTDGQGNATVASAAAVRGPNGATGVRAGITSVGADGSATHRSGFAAQGANGSVQSQGGATRAADGDVTQSRATSATSNASGASITSTVSYHKDTGRTRTTSCFNASGATIGCPAKPGVHDARSEGEPS
jgi:hypothetical protein